MYTSFFGLNEKPFSITPDPRYLFLSERHGEALAHLVYGVTESGGFMQLTGEVGTGKTTLVRTLLQNKLPDNADVAVILNPQLSALEFLHAICEELGIGDGVDTGSSKALIDALNHYLLMAHSEGRRTILMVDEAQNLARDVLEQVRLLTNLETSKQKLLQIILIGQPELRELLARNDLRQLAQRITGRYHLEPLSRTETAKYIEHRLQVAGAVGEVFDSGAKKEVFRISGGIPRIVNVICDRALLGAYSRESRRVSAAIVRRAAREITGKPVASTWLRWLTPLLIATGMSIVAVGGWSMYRQHQVDSGPPQLASQPMAEPDVAARETTPAVVVDSPAGSERVTNTAAGDQTSANGTPTANTAAVDEPSLDEQLQLATGLTDINGALNVLFDRWGLPQNRVRTCADASAAGYECLFQRGSWLSLRQLNRPAILTLTDSGGNMHNIVLLRLHGNEADLSIAGIDVTHPISDVSAVWFGQFMLLWQPPHGTSVAMGPGSEGPQVTWLRQSLAAISDSYRAEPLASAVFDASLEDSVRAFQRDHRLVVDGLAGRQTQIIINSLLGNGDFPRLLEPSVDAPTGQTLAQE